MKNLRILHVLSPVKWNNDTFNSSADSNWKVCEKTINFLPDCHHYVLVPLSHDIKLNDRDNVSFIRYNYPKSVQINRGIFDYRQVKFDFKKIDIDFVFTHQPELTFNIQQWFHTNRYYEDVAYFGFYHWIDCNASRGSTSGCPSFYMRQLESMHILDGNFVHSDVSLEYFKSNFKNVDCTSLLKDVYYMPLSSKLEAEPTPFDLPKKKILLFNHRWNKSSGIEKLIEFTNDLSDEYLIWVTDENCDIKDPRFMVKHLKYSDYVYLVNNCYASLCFISGYSTWNLSAQDSLLAGVPLLYFKHKTIELVVGNKNLGYFKTKEEFYHLLENLPEVNKDILYEHDFLFELQLKTAMNKYWYDTKNVPSNTDKWIDCIKNNITDKQSIVRKVYGNDWGTSSAHFIRRHLLNNGVLDDTSKPYSDYYMEGEERIIKRDLFSQL